MTKTYGVVLAALLVGVFTFSASAQVPTLAIYFDEGTHRVQQKDSPNAPVGTVTDQYYVVMNNVNQWVWAVEFSISNPSSIAWESDNHLGTPLHIGNSPSGVAIAWNKPQNAFAPFLVLKVNFTWMSDGCIGREDDEITVLPAPWSGQLRATSWPDHDVVQLMGASGLVCSGSSTPTENTTWGRVKSLYE